MTAPLRTHPPTFAPFAPTNPLIASASVCEASVHLFTDEDRHFQPCVDMTVLSDDTRHLLAVPSIERTALIEDLILEVARQISVLKQWDTYQQPAQAFSEVAAHSRKEIVKHLSTIEVHDRHANGEFL